MNVSSSRHTLARVLEEHAARAPHREAHRFVEGSLQQSLTYQALDELSRGVAARIRELSGPGDRVLLLFPPGIEFLAGFMGCLYANTIAVPAPPPDPRNLPRTLTRLSSVLKDADACLILTTRAILSMRNALVEHNQALQSIARVPTLAVDACEPLSRHDYVLDDASEEEPAFLQYTSGSTGTPRGVVITHKNLLANEKSLQRAFQHHQNTTIVSWLPVYHDMGLIGGLLQALFVGGRSIQMSPESFLRRPLQWLQWIDRARAHSSGGPNFAYDLCARRITEEEAQKLDLTHWKVAFNGAEPVRAETMERFARAFAPSGFSKSAFAPCYGLAESTLFVSGSARGAGIAHVDADALSRGRLSPSPTEPARLIVGAGDLQDPDIKVRIVHMDTHREVKEGVVGEIWVQSDSNGLGYWRQPQKTREIFRATLHGSPGLWLRTGDLGAMYRGKLFVTGRIKDLIIIRGVNHYPQDLENTAFQQSKKLLRPGSIAAFTRISDDALVLVCETRRSLEESEISQLYKSIRAAIAQEHGVTLQRFVGLRRGEIPKTSSGKIQRRLCRSLLQSQDLIPVFVRGKQRSTATLERLRVC